VENNSSWSPIIPETGIDAFIFDCDGTLADTMPIHYKAWCAALGEHAVLFPEPMFNDLGGVPTHRVVEILNERHQLTLPVHELVAIKEALFQEWSLSAQPIAPVVAVAKRFHQIKPMAVASGGHRHIVRRTLDIIGILDLFGAVVCSEDTPRGKPHADPFLEAARRLGVAPERCLVFEDSITGLNAAQAAGMQCIIVPHHAR
jgi:HAD superfamily hydrolase (TIGR01509 family)